MSDEGPSIGRKAVRGTIWAAADRFGTLAVQFGVNLILARLLTPADYGMIGMLAIFITVSQTLIDSGFGSALIQRREVNEADFSTIFWWNTGIAALLYAIIWLSAPFVDSFFKLPGLGEVLRVLGLVLFFYSINAVQIVRLRRRLAFGRIAAINLLSYILAACAAVTCAMYGAGVWSLVVLQVGQAVIYTTLLALVERWHPRLIFSVGSLRQLFGFGGYLLASTLLQNICQNMQGVIIGHRFSAADTGYYAQAQKLDQVSSYSLPQVLVQVLFPVLSSMQDDRQRLIATLSRSVALITWGVVPLMIILAITALPLITLMFGQEWAPSAPYFRILCAGGLFVSMQNVNFFAVAAVGRSRELFYWSFYKWSALLVLLFAGVQFGVEGLLWGMVISNFNIWLVNILLARRYVGMPLRSQAAPIVRYILIAAVAFLLTWSAGLLISIHPFGSALIFALLYLLMTFRRTEPQALLSKLRGKA